MVSKERVQGDFFKRLGHWEEKKKVSHVGEEFKADGIRWVPYG